MSSERSRYGQRAAHASALDACVAGGVLLERMMPYYLCIGADTLDDACGYARKSEALATFRDVAEGLARFGQAIEGTIHIAPSRSEMAEYPDYVLSLGPRGGIRCERG